MSLLNHINRRLEKVMLKESDLERDISNSRGINFDGGERNGKLYTVNDIVFKEDDGLGGMPFQDDLENELDEIADLCINGDPRLIEQDDRGVTFEEIAVSMHNLDENGYVKKQLLKKGVGPKPPPYARMLVHYDFFKEGSEEPFDSTYLRGKPAKLRLDENEIIPGLETALKSMQKKESAKFLFKWEVAFGRQGCPPRIPKECDVLAYVNVVDITELVSNGDDVEYVNGEVTLSKFGRIFKDAKFCHCEGNEEFAIGHYKLAIKNYRKAIAVLNEIRLANEEEEKRMLNLKSRCLVNLAVCFNRINKPEQACIVARQALGIDENNIKAMFQYGKSNLILSNLDVAEKWLRKAISLKPEDEDIRKELNTLIVKKEKAKDADTRFAQKAFPDLRKNPKKSTDKK